MTKFKTKKIWVVWGMAISFLTGCNLASSGITPTIVSPSPATLAPTIPSSAPSQTTDPWQMTLQAGQTQNAEIQETISAQQTQVAESSSKTTLSPSPIPTSTPTLAPVSIDPFQAIPIVAFNEIARITQVFPTTNGKIWFLTDFFTSFFIDKNNAIKADVPGYLLGVDQTDNAWIYDSDSDEIYSGNGVEWIKYTRETGWPSVVSIKRWPVYRPLITDLTGNIWITTYNDTRYFNQQEWKSFSPEQVGLPTITLDEFFDGEISKTIKFIKSSSEVWVGQCNWIGPGPLPNEGGVRWYDGQSWRGADSPIATGCATEIKEDSTGQVWIGLNDTLWKYNPTTEQWTSFPPPAPPEGTARFGFFTQLAISPAGDVWAALSMCGGASCMTGDALYRLVEDQWQQVGGISDFSSAQFFFTSDGVTWLFQWNTLFRVNGNELVIETTYPGQVVFSDDETRIWLTLEQDGQSGLYVIAP